MLGGSEEQWLGGRASGCECGCGCGCQCSCSSVGRGEQIYEALVGPTDGLELEWQQPKEGAGE